MKRNEAVLKLIKVARISEAYAEDLYDSFFEKPVVPQYVADWYEEHKGDFDYELWDYFTNWDDQEDDDFKEWIREGENQPIIALINMHQFGYEVEKEKQYTVKIKAVLGQYLGKYYLNDEELTPQFTRTQFTVDKGRPTFTRKELEDANFGWVFDCEGVEVKEVTDEND